MADAADVADGIIAEHIARGIAAVMRETFEPGEPGECTRCGEVMPRIVDGHCAPCRDGRWRHG